MTKKKTLIKNALSNPDLYSAGELSFFEMWLSERKKRKALKKQQKQEEL